MNRGGSPEMDFGPRHHSGMPNTAELRWRQSIEAAAYEERYYPFGRENSGPKEQIVETESGSEMIDRAIGAAWWVTRLMEYSETHPEVRDVLDTALERMQRGNAGPVEETNPDFLPRSASENARRNPEDRYWRMLAKHEHAWNTRMD